MTTQELRQEVEAIKASLMQCEPRYTRIAAEHPLALIGAGFATGLLVAGHRKFARSSFLAVEWFARQILQQSVSRLLPPGSIR